MTSVRIYRMRRAIESWYPPVLAFLAFGVLFFYPYSGLSLKICQQLSGQYLSIFSIFFGFAFASVALLLSLEEKPFIRGMKQTGALKQLIRYHINCMIWCMFGIMCAVVISFCSEQYFQPYFASAFVAVGVGTLLATWRVIHLFLQLLGYLRFL